MILIIKYNNRIKFTKAHTLTQPNECLWSLITFSIGLRVYNSGGGGAAVLKVYVNIL